jgi:hypothetical protein
MSKSEQFAAQMEQFAADSDGKVRVYLVRYDDYDLQAMVQIGEPWAIVLAGTVGLSLKKMGQMIIDGEMPLCAICQHEFDGHSGSPGAFMIWLPDAVAKRIHDPKERRKLVAKRPSGVAEPICMKCCEQDDRKLLAHSTVMLEHIFSDVEVVEEDYK